MHQPCDQVNDPTNYFNLEWGKYFGVSFSFMQCAYVKINQITSK